MHVTFAFSSKAKSVATEAILIEGNTYFVKDGTDLGMYINFLRMSGRAERASGRILEMSWRPLSIVSTILPSSIPIEV
jgi:hypothetical protein